MSSPTTRPRPSFRPDSSVQTLFLSLLVRVLSTGSVSPDSVLQLHLQACADKSLITVAIPAVKTIDTFGRRNLLLTTFPLMGIFLLFTGFSFYIESDQARLGCVATGIYLFMVVYSPGEGPVPFTYSAEAFPLYIREVGMAFATATTWGFNFILSLTWPALVQAFTEQGVSSRISHLIFQKPSNIETGIRVVCSMEFHRLDVRLLLFTRDEGSILGRA